MKTFKFVSVFVFIFLIAISVSPISSDAIKPSVRNNITLIPAYFYPTEDDFLKLTISKTVRTQVVILNPDNGPSGTVDDNYKDAIRRLLLKRKIPIAYVYTGYGKRDINDIKADIDRWYKFYPNIRGIFLDEVSDEEEFISLYSTIYKFIKDKYKGMVVINPGTNFPQKLLYLCDYAVVFEGDPYELNNFKISDSLKNNLNKLVFLVYGVGDENIEEVLNDITKRGVKSFYITDDDLPNPWDKLSKYFERF